MTNAGDALLQAILDEPDADDVRLIYADWLQDQGQDLRAEFIRVQIEMHGTLCSSDPEPQEVERTPYSMYCNSTDCRHCELDRRADKLCTNAKWLPAVAYAKGTGRRALYWRRGFLHGIEAPFAFLTQHLPALVREQPVKLANPNDRQPHFDNHASGRWRWYRGTTGLRYSDRLGDAWAFLPGSYQRTFLDPPRHTVREHDGFESEEEAHEGAAQAMVAWAKSIQCLRCNDTKAAQRFSDDVSVFEVGDCPACTFKPVRYRSKMIENVPAPLAPRFFLGGTS